jgi:hypothetical protein
MAIEPQNKHRDNNDELLGLYFLRFLCAVTDGFVSRVAQSV